MISLGFLWVSPGARALRVSFFGYKQERTNQKKREKNKEAVKTGSKEAEEQEVQQQKHMTEEKKK